MVVTNNKRSSNNTGEISPDVPVFLQSEFSYYVFNYLCRVDVRLAVLACPPVRSYDILYPVPIGFHIYWQFIIKG